MLNLENFSKQHYRFFLILIFVVAVVLRWWFLPLKNINFIFDQARDAFAAQQISDGHLKILGPPTSGIPGLSHGVLYYYIIAPIYLLGRGDPVIVVYVLSLIGAFAILPVFYLTYLLTKKYLPSILAVFIFAFSFDGIQFSNFLSNVSLGILFVPVIFIGLFLWIKKKSKFAPVITGLAFGLAVQSEVAFCFYLAPIVIWLFIYRKNILKKDVAFFILAFLVATSTIIIAEIKFGFPGIKGIYLLLSGQNTMTQTKQFSSLLTVFINQIGERLSYTTFPLNHILGEIIGYAMVVYAFIRKSTGKNENSQIWKPFLITYISAYILIIPFGGSITPYITIGVIPAVSIFLAIFLSEVFWRKDKLLILVIFVIISINFFSFVLKNKSPNPDYFTNNYLLSTELKIVDYTYQKANGKPFSISSLTAPLYINTLWSYLYNWYGWEKYGYLPSWIGRDQVGQLGDNLKTPTQDTKEHFFIMEPTSAIPDIWVNYAIGDQNSISVELSRKSFGNFVVEERQMKNE